MLEKELDTRWQAYLDSGRTLEDPILDAIRPTVLDPGERWWRDMYELIEQAGYRLRPRYRPGWRPSWEGTKEQHQDCEDGHAPFFWVNFLFCTQKIQR
jgi:hypothetical protein